MSWVLVLAVAACQDPKEEGKPMAPIEAVEYGSTQADEALPTELRVRPGRESELWIRSNRDGPERTAVGFFRKALVPADTEALLPLLDAPDFHAAANPAAVVPGEIVRKIAVRYADGKELLRFVGEEAPAPAAFARAEQALLKLVEATAAGPRLAVSVAVEPVPSAVDAKTPVAFRLTFRNPGAEAIRVAMPKGWAGSHTEVEWKGLRSDVPLAHLGNAHAMALRLEPTHAVDVPADEWRTLEPGASVSLDFKAAWRWTPGVYDLQLSCLSSLRAEDGRTATRFEWVSPKTRLEAK